MGPMKSKQEPGAPMKELKVLPGVLKGLSCSMMLRFYQDVQGLKIVGAYCLCLFFLVVLFLTFRVLWCCGFWAGRV